MRRNFNLEKADFSEESDEDLQLPSQQMLHLYNTEYNFILQQTSQFFSQCKEAIQKFMSLNQFGVGFNIPLLYTSVIKMEQSLMGLTDNQKQHLSEKKQQTHRYEGTFHKIMARMSKVIEDFIDFQINFKSEYFGQTAVKPETMKKKIKNMKKIAYHESLYNHSASSGSSGKQNTQEENNENETKQKQIRAILQKKMCPQTLKLQKVCTVTNQPSINLKSLSEKIDLMRKNVRDNRLKQEKIIEIFNKKKFSTQNGATQTPVVQELTLPDDDNISTYSNITKNPVFQKMRKKHLMITDDGQYNN